MLPDDAVLGEFNRRDEERAAAAAALDPARAAKTLEVMVGSLAASLRIDLETARYYMTEHGRDCFVNNFSNGYRGIIYLQGNRSYISVYMGRGGQPTNARLPPCRCQSKRLSMSQRRSRRSQ